MSVNLDELTEQCKRIYAAAYKVKGFPETPPLEGVRRAVDRWYENKSWIIEHFPEELRREMMLDEHNFSYREISISAFRDQIDTIAGKVRYEALGHRRFRKLILEKLVEKLRNMARSLSNPGDVILENKVTVDLKMTDSIYANCPEGMRLTKALPKWYGYMEEYFLERANGPIQREFRKNFTAIKEGDSELKDTLFDMINTMYSIVVSRLKTTSQQTAVLSVHPVDYLLQSSHTHGGWTSCHEVGRGAHSSGAMGYMTDEGTLVGWTHKNDIEPVTVWSGHHELVKGLELPKKLKRQMVLLDLTDKPMALLSRMYPSPSESAEKTIRKLTGHLLRDIYDIDLDENWTRRKSPRRYVNYSRCSTIYGDSTRSMIYFDPHGDISVNVHAGDSVFCPICGAEKERHNPLCKGCKSEYIPECTHCGRSVRVEYREEIDAYICSRCWEEHYALCYYCDEVVPREDENYLLSVDQFVCSPCQTERNLQLCRRCNYLASEEDTSTVMKFSQVIICIECHNYLLRRSRRGGLENNYLALCVRCDQVVRRSRYSNVKTDDGYRTYCVDCEEEIDIQGELIKCSECDSKMLTSAAHSEYPTLCKTCGKRQDVVDSYSPYLVFMDHDGDTGQSTYAAEDATHTETHNETLNYTVEYEE